MTEQQTTDRELIDAYLQGKEAAFEELYGRYRLPLYSYLNKTLAGQTAVVDDLYQKTWIRVIDHLHKYTDRQKFLSWLLRIGHNVAMDHFRSQARWNHVEIDDRIAADTVPPGNRMDDEELNGALGDAVEHLSSEQREVLELRRQDVSFKEIARIQNVSINTVLGRMHYAVQNLQKMLAEWL